MTVTGYALSELATVPAEPMLGDAVSASRYVAKLYVHDDNVGPFARCVPIAVPDDAPHDSSAPMAFQLCSRAGEIYSRFLPDSVLIPIYDKVRITYSEAHTWATRVQMVMREAGLDSDFRWSIELTSTTIYKAGLRAERPFKKNSIPRLEESQPRFLLKASVAEGTSDPIAEFLIDATALARSCPLFAARWLDAEAEESFRLGVIPVAKSFVRAFGPIFADVILGR